MAELDILLDGDTWKGWDGTSAFTDVGNDWDFTTAWGVAIESRTDWASAFRAEARRRGKLRAKGRALNQKENSLSGSMTIRGSKFITIGDDGEIFKFYKKGTQILFRKPDTGLANNEGNFYNLIVKKVTHTIDSSLWRTILDVEYDKFVIDEQIKSLI